MRYIYFILGGARPAFAQAFAIACVVGLFASEDPNVWAFCALMGTTTAFSMSEG